MSRKQKNTNKIHLIAIASFVPIFAILWGILLFVPFARGFASFPIKTVQCGHQPYIADGFAGSRTFTTPEDKLYHGPNIFTQNSDYYCTEKEVTEARYTSQLWQNVCEPRYYRARPEECYPGGDGSGVIMRFASLVGIVAVTLAYGVSFYATRRKT